MSVDLNAFAAYFFARASLLDVRYNGGKARSYVKLSNTYG